MSRVSTPQPSPWRAQLDPASGSDRTTQREGRLGFVVPRYGADVVGGSETATREIAHGLARRGWDVDILTTCARDHFTWENTFAPGIENDDDGVRVIRFLATVGADRTERYELGHAILAGEQLDLHRQQRWINSDLRVPDLFHHLVDTSDSYRALVFSPYLFWPTYACGQIAPERSLVMPCLHDEPFAYLKIFEQLFCGTRGIWFLSEPERDLAKRLHPKLTAHEVIGSGVHVPQCYDPEGFRARHGLTEPFVLYAGRREEYGKNWQRLLGDFERAVHRSNLPLRLVTIGSGPVNPPHSIADRVIDLGFVSDKERDDAFAAASAYVQPSAYESFSRTMMEAWLAGTLVIAFGGSEVNRWHCERSRAGLVYDDEFEFEQCLRFVVEEPEAAQQIAEAGRDYVLANYTWDTVLDRAEQTIDEWLPSIASP